MRWANPDVDKQQFQPTNINKTELLGLEHNDFKHLFFVFFL